MGLWLVALETAQPMNPKIPMSFACGGRSRGLADGDEGGRPVLSFSDVPRYACKAFFAGESGGDTHPVSLD